MSMGGGAAFKAARVATRSVRPVPLAPCHVLGTTLSFPPDTAFCRDNIGISCYQPAQFQQAYDLKPLFNAGASTGAGSTIVIVDAFGSPTIAADLQHFDQTFGLPDPPSFQEIEPAGAVPAFPADPFGAGRPFRVGGRDDPRRRVVPRRWRRGPTSCWWPRRHRRPRASRASPRSCRPRTTSSTTTWVT